MRIVANSELSVLEATDMLEVMVAQGLWRQTIIDEEDREPCRSSPGGDGLGGVPMPRDVFVERLPCHDTTILTP